MPKSVKQIRQQARPRFALPTSTALTVDAAASIPRGVDAVVVFATEGDVPDVRLGAQTSLRSAFKSHLAPPFFAGKAKETLAVPAELDDRPTVVVLVGLGKPEKVTPESLRQATGAAVRAFKKFKPKSVAVLLPELDAVAPEAAAEAITTAALLVAFRYDEYKGARRGRDADERPALTLSLVHADIGGIRDAVTRATIVAESQNFARTIAHRPGNDINPPSLARAAQQLAKAVGLTCRVMDERELKRLNMGGILAVGGGSSDTPPRLIVLEHNPRIRNPKSKIQNSQPLLFVGKAITFDTGGISIKPAERMGKMVFDKCGGIAVLGAMCAIARLNLPVRVVGILSAAENHISQSAYRPGDILRMHNGVTVEVTNTDAEGRLVLGDALAWGIETYKPSAVVDLATLTGGCVVALGVQTAGVFANNDELFDELSRSARRAGEKVWRLPLLEEIKDLIKSDTADVVNSAGRWGSPIQGAVFLSHFVSEGTPWIHMDIAGVSDSDKDLPYYGKGALGWGVRTLVDLAQSRAAPASTHAIPRAAGG